MTFSGFDGLTNSKCFSSICTQRSHQKQARSTKDKPKHQSVRPESAAVCGGGGGGPEVY